MENRREFITKGLSSGLILAMNSLVLPNDAEATPSIGGKEWYTCSKIDKDGGVSNRGKTIFGLNEMIYLVLDTNTLFGGDGKISFLRKDGSEISNYTSYLNGGQRSWMYSSKRAESLGRPDTYTGRFSFRGNHLGDVQFRVVIKD